jgi:MYXO-CTERM domain-containing protein
MQTSISGSVRMALLAACCVTGIQSTARADLGACGEVDLRANAECTVVPPTAQCETMCTPISVRAACSAKLAASCDAECSKLPSVDCDVSCQAGCKADCNIDPGKFDCRIDCQADCDGRCTAGCASSGDKTKCMASCSGSCSASCDKRCDVELPRANCDAACKASCDGSCRVDTNLDCQIDCQAKGYVKCEADVTGGCKTRCKSTEGALFCDGNFVDTGDKLQECADALKAALNAHVMGSSSGSSDCTNGVCSAKGEAEVSSDCSVAAVGGKQAQTGTLWLLLAAAGSVWRMRRRKASRED